MPAKVLNKWEGEDEDDEVKVSNLIPDFNTLFTL